MRYLLLALMLAGMGAVMLNLSWNWPDILGLMALLMAGGVLARTPPRW